MQKKKDEMRSTMKRIFMVGYSNNKGGVEAYIDQLTKGLPQYEIVLSLPVMSVDGKEWHRPGNRHCWLRYRLFWHRFFQKNRFDAVYYNTCDVVSLDMLRFAKYAGVPMRIIHSHNTGNQQETGRHAGLFHRLSEKINRRNLYRYATHLLACSEEAGRWMFGDRPFTVIRNGIDAEKFRYREEARTAVREQYGLGNRLLIAVIGRLSAQKNPNYALLVLEALFRADPEARAVFAGDGSLRKETEEEAGRKGIRDRILFTGAVDNVQDWMSAADALLMPSLFEGMPFVLVEAQAAGLPCVVSSSVTREADLTGLVRFMDLENTPERWADVLLTPGKQARTGYAEQIVSAGYSMRHTAEQVAGIIENGGTVRN